MERISNNYVGWDGWIGKRVCAKKTMFGTLRYFGETKFSSGLWCGIELNNAEGRNDGTVNNIRYFSCLPNYGIFVPITKVEKVNEYVEHISNSMCEADLNKTFEVARSSGNTTKEVKEILNEEFKSINLVDEAIEIAKDNLLKSRMDSEESLGILNPDLIKDLENSWDSLTLNFSISDISINKNLMLGQENVDTVFVPSNNAEEFENVFSNTITPQYASTPRQVIHNKFGNCIDVWGSSSPILNGETKSSSDEPYPDRQEILFNSDDLKNTYNLLSTSKTLLNDTTLSNLVCNQKTLTLEKNNLNYEQSTISNEPYENKQIEFDVDKLKNNPNLSSTSKTFLNDTASSNFLTNQKILIPEEINVMFEPSSLNKTQTFPNNWGNIINTNNNLNATFELNKTVSLVKPGLNETKESLNPDTNKEMLNLNMNDHIKNGESLNIDLSDICQENVNLKNEVNLNATYEFKCLDSKNLELPNVETRITTVNLKMDDTCNLDLSEITLHNNSPLKNTLVLDSSLLKDKLSDSSITEKALSTTFINDKKSCVQNESFSHKSKFLQECMLDNSCRPDLSTRNSICLPLSSRNSISIRTRKTSDNTLNSTFRLPNKERFKCKEKPCTQKNRKSMSTTLFTSKANMPGKFNMKVKKEVTPLTTVHDSKTVPKSHSSIITTGIKHLSQPKVDLKYSKSSHKVVPSKLQKFNALLNENKISGNKDSNESDVVKSSNKKGPNGQEKFVPKSKFYSTISSSTSVENSFSKLSQNAVKSIKLTNTANIMPIKPENKENANNLKNCSNIQSKFGFKNIPANGNLRSAPLKIPLPNNRSNISYLKKKENQVHKTLNNPPLSQHNELPDNELNITTRNLPENKRSDISLPNNTQLRIPRRNSIAVCSKERLPVGVIKPMFSLLHSIADVSNENIASSPDCASGRNSNLRRRNTISTKSSTISRESLLKKYPGIKGGNMTSVPQKLPRSTGLQNMKIAFKK